MPQGSIKRVNSQTIRWIVWEEGDFTIKNLPAAGSTGRHYGRPKVAPGPSKNPQPQKWRAVLLAIFAFCVTATCKFRSYTIVLLSHLQVLFLDLQMFGRSGRVSEQKRTFLTPCGRPKVAPTKTIANKNSDEHMQAHAMRCMDRLPCLSAVHYIKKGI